MANVITQERIEIFTNIIIYYTNKYFISIEKPIKNNVHVIMTFKMSI